MHTPYKGASQRLPPEKACHSMKKTQMLLVAPLFLLASLLQPIESTKIQPPEPVEAVKIVEPGPEKVEAILVEEEPTKKKTWSELTLQEKINKNPNKCDLTTQVMWESDGSCHTILEPTESKVIQGSNPKTATVKSDSVAPKKKVGSPSNKEEWMRLAGIPQSDWWAVDYIVSRESSWNPQAVNPNGGACGLAQSLPCSKIAKAGLQWNNPVDALKWQFSYVKSRYGGYPQAVNFWKAHHWY